MASYSYSESYESGPVSAGYVVSDVSYGGRSLSGSYGSSSGGILVGSSGGSGGFSYSASSSGDASGAIAADLLSSGLSVGVSGGSSSSYGVSSGSSYGVSGGSSYGVSGGGSYGVSGGYSLGGGSSFAVDSGFSSSSGGSSAVLEASAFSAVEQAILRASNPVEFSESESLTVNGQSGIWINRNEVLNWRGVIPISSYSINEDSNPEVIRKRSDQQVVYEQEVAVRYLRPPTPPPPGEILIRQEKNIATPPAPPLVIRQQPPRPETPAPLVIREAPPRPPASVGQKVITISGKRIPPPPRKVVIERLAPLPSKPQSYLIERWLPYSSQKRRVIFQRNQEPDPVVQRPRNVVIQWEAPQVQIKREFKDLGVVRANPAEYVQRYGASLKSHTEFPAIAREIRPAAGVVLAAEYNAPSLIELEGDVQALSLIDLDREGLGEYRAWLSRFGVSGGSASSASFSSSSASASASGSGSGSAVFQVSISQLLNAIFLELFRNVDLNANSRISVSEAESVVVKLNQRLGRNYSSADAAAFFRSLDSNRDGQVDFNEFRSALLRQFNAY